MELRQTALEFLATTDFIMLHARDQVWVGLVLAHEIS